MRQIATSVGISTESVHTILHQHFKIKKLCTRQPKCISVSKTDCVCFGRNHKTIIVLSLWTKYGYSTKCLYTRNRTFQTIGLLQKWSITVPSALKVMTIFICDCLEIIVDHILEITKLLQLNLRHPSAHISAIMVASLKLTSPYPQNLVPSNYCSLHYEKKTWARKNLI